MERNIHYVGPEASIWDTLMLSNEKRVRHVPIVEDGKLLGIVSDRDLRDVSPSTLVDGDTLLLRSTKVKEIMHTNLITVHPLDAMEDAARMIYDHRIGCLPVVQEDHLVGMVTTSDLLHAMVDVMGVSQPGSYIEIEVPDQPGALLEVATIVKEQNTNIISLYITPGKREGYRIIVLRVATWDPRAIIDRIGQAGYTLLFPVCFLNQGGVK